MDQTLNIHTAVNIAKVVEMAQTNARVGWVPESGDIMEGTVRCIGDERGNHLNNDEDVRNAFLRITTTMGWEVFMPMSEAISKVSNYKLVVI